MIDSHDWKLSVLSLLVHVEADRIEITGVRPANLHITGLQKQFRETALGRRSLLGKLIQIRSPSKE